jgi:hypothetical protein
MPTPFLPNVVPVYQSLKPVSSTSNRLSKKKKNKQRHEGPLMVAAERKGKKAPAKGTLDHFKKMLEGPCPNHGYTVKHALKDYGLMRKFLAGSSTKGEHKKPDPKEDDPEGGGDIYPTETDCLMIFGVPEAYASKHRQKLERREVYEAEPAMPAFLKWSRPSPSTSQITRITSHDQAATCLWLTPSSPRSASPRY